jgi:hypothetical protein
MRYVMRSFFRFAALLLALQSAALAGSLPSGIGWHELPNTRLRPHCPTETQYPGIYGGTGCDSVTIAWGGAAFDIEGNRLLLNGGGHADWGGNEVYELDLDSVVMRRLNNPSYPLRDGCAAGTDSTYADGRPVSRHTYNHLAYIEEQDLMFLFGGSRWFCGYFGDDTWTFDPALDRWTARDNTDAPIGEFGLSISRDPATGLLWARDSRRLHAYDPAVHRWQRRSSDSDLSLSNYRSAVIDPVRGRYFLYTAGDRTLHHYDLRSTAALLTIVSRAAPSCTFMDRDAAGWAYDPRLGRLVAWVGGDTVHLLDPDSATCSTLSFPGGPVAVQQGTYGRFAYSPREDAYVSCNDIDENCRILRLRSGDGVFASGYE